MEQETKKKHVSEKLIFFFFLINEKMNQWQHGQERDKKVFWKHVNSNVRWSILFQRNNGSIEMGQGTRCFLYRREQ